MAMNFVNFDDSILTTIDVYKALNVFSDINSKLLSGFNVVQLNKNNGRQVIKFQKNEGNQIEIANPDNLNHYPTTTPVVEVTNLPYTSIVQTLLLNIHDINDNNYNPNNALKEFYDNLSAIMWRLLLDGKYRTGGGDGVNFDYSIFNQNAGVMCDATSASSEVGVLDKSKPAGVTNYLDNIMDAIEANGARANHVYISNQLLRSLDAIQRTDTGEASRVFSSYCKDKEIEIVSSPYTNKTTSFNIGAKDGLTLHMGTDYDNTEAKDHAQLISVLKRITMGGFIAAKLEFVTNLDWMGDRVVVVTKLGTTVSSK